MFPPKKDGGSKDKAKPKGKPEAQGQAPPHPAHQAAPQFGPKPGQGMDPMEAMMGGMGDLSQFAPPPPPPGAPLGPDGMPIGGGPGEGFPGFDPSMDGSSLFQALHASLDPYAAGPLGHGELDPPPDLDSLLAMLAFRQSGVAPGGSGVMPQPTTPGLAEGLQHFSVIR